MKLTVSDWFYLVQNVALASVLFVLGVFALTHAQGCAPLSIP